MLISVLKSKIHLATITSSEINYEGSIAIDPRLLKASGIVPGEKVAVLNADNAHRFETYTIVGKAGEIGLRGPAARLGTKGHQVIILAFGHMTPAEAKKFKSKKVFVDGHNRIKSVK